MHWYDLTNADSHSLFCTSLFFMQTICLFWHWHHGSQSGEARRSSPGRPRARGFSTHQLGQPVPAEMSKSDSMWRYASFREFGGLGKNRRYRMFSTFLPVAVLLLGEAVFLLLLFFLFFFFGGGGTEHLWAKRKSTLLRQGRPVAWWCVPATITIATIAITIIEISWSPSSSTLPVVLAVFSSPVGVLRKGMRGKTSLVVVAHILEWGNSYIQGGFFNWPPLKS